MSAALPKSWIIDYRTAYGMCASDNEAHLSACIAGCEGGRLFISHHEESYFRGNATLKENFLVKQMCVYEPNEHVYEKCRAIRNAACSKKVLRNSEAKVFITAAALTEGYGVISCERSDSFMTVFDFCDLYGIPVIGPDQCAVLFK